MLKRHIEVGGEIFLHADGALNFEIGLFKFRTPLNHQPAPARYCIEIKISRPFLVKSEIVEMNVSLDRRLLWRAARFRREIGPAIHREAAALQLRKMHEVQILSGDIRMKLSSGKVHCAGRARRSVIQTSGQVAKLQFVTYQAEIAAQEWEDNSVNSSVVNLNVPLTRLLRSRARHMKRQIAHSANGLLESRQLSNLSYVAVVHIDTQSERRSRLRCAGDQSGIQVEACASSAVQQDTVVSGKALAGILDGGRKRIPVNRLCRALRAGRNHGVEIIDFQVSIYRHKGQPAGQNAVERCPSVDRERQTAGPVGGLKQRPPFFQVMTGCRDFERRIRRQTA